MGECMDSIMAMKTCDPDEWYYKGCWVKGAYPETISAIAEIEVRTLGVTEYTQSPPKTDYIDASTIVVSYDTLNALLGQYVSPGNPKYVGIRICMSFTESNVVCTTTSRFSLECKMYTIAGGEDIRSCTFIFDTKRKKHRERYIEFQMVDKEFETFQVTTNPNDDYMCCERLC